MTLSKSRKKFNSPARICLLITAYMAMPMALAQTESSYAWRAGDHHIHSRYSAGWNQEESPPAAIIGGDAIYPIHMNALMANYFGLEWMVSTDHGGPNHSKLNLHRAYPELVRSRLAVPDVLQFYGMEFDTPGADHSSLIIPYTEAEARQLFELESAFAKREPWPADPSWDSEPRMLMALTKMHQQSPLPLLIANHPSRSATDLGVYGADKPAELRAWNDTAPEVAVGMAGAPGHQAATLKPDGSLDPEASRGSYKHFPTLGGFDQFTARVGGFWDSMLGEGRNWWITANSDSHVHFSEGGSDFWPGEYSKTYVWAERSHASVMDGIRSGRVFVTTGDLIDALSLTVTTPGTVTGNIGDAISVNAGSDIEIIIRFHDVTGKNYNGHSPEVERVDLIRGTIIGPLSDPSSDDHPGASVLARFGVQDWAMDGEFAEIRYALTGIKECFYLRVRGTNTRQLEPQVDPKGEDPWSDLWFYSNPVRVLVFP